MGCAEVSMKSNLNESLGTSHEIFWPVWMPCEEKVNGRICDFPWDPLGGVDNSIKRKSWKILGLSMVSSGLCGGLHEQEPFVKSWDFTWDPLDCVEACISNNILLKVYVLSTSQEVRLFMESSRLHHLSLRICSLFNSVWILMQGNREPWTKYKNSTASTTVDKCMTFQGWAWVRTLMLIWTRLLSRNVLAQCLSCIVLYHGWDQPKQLRHSKCLLKTHWRITWVVETRRQRKA